MNEKDVLIVGVVDGGDCFNDITVKFTVPKTVQLPDGWFITRDKLIHMLTVPQKHLRDFEQRRCCRSPVQEELFYKWASNMEVSE